MAGLLNVRLGGLNYYEGRPVLGAYLGEPTEPLTPVKIDEALQHLSLAYIVFLAGLSLTGLVLKRVSG
jgi:cobalamin biosynthesis protein CobD/CbiB